MKDTEMHEFINIVKYVKHIKSKVWQKSHESPLINTPQNQSKHLSLKTRLAKFTGTGVITAVAAAPLSFTN